MTFAVKLLQCHQQHVPTGMSLPAAVSGPVSQQLAAFNVGTTLLQYQPSPSPEGIGRWYTSNCCWWHVGMHDHDDTSSRT